MTVAVSVSDTFASDAMCPDDREVLERLIEYAIAEADRQGELVAAAHMSQALAAIKGSLSGHDATMAHGDPIRRLRS